MPGNLVSRRRFFKISTVALSGAVLAGCAGKPAPAQQGQVAPATPVPKSSVTGTFRYAFDNETETRKPAVDLFFQKFYPNMKVTYEVTPSGYFEKLLAQIASGDVPDLAYIHESRFADFASQGALMPLDDYLAKMPLIDGNDKYPLEILKRNNNWKGKWYTMPIGAAFLFVRYNKDLFKAANVPLPTDKWTWSDFLTAAAALTKDTNNDGKPEQWGWIGWNPGWMPAQWPLMQSYGSFHFTDDLSQCVINNDAGLQVYEFIRSTFCGKTLCSPTPAAKTQLQSGTVRLFEGGLAAMDYTLSPNVISALKNIAGKFEMGIEISPAGPKGSFVRTGGSSMGLPKGCKKPDVSWDLLRWMIGDEEAGKLAATYLDGNPLVRLDHIVKYNVPEGPLKDQMVRIITDGFQKYGTVVQYAPIGEYGAIVTSNVDKLAACEITAKQCVDAIADAANKALKDKK